MEKPQVTFAVQAYQLRGKVGNPICVASVVLERDVRQLVFYVGNFGQVAEEVRLDLPVAPLNSHYLELTLAHGNASLSRALTRAVGVQLELEGDDA